MKRFLQKKVLFVAMLAPAMINGGFIYKPNTFTTVYPFSEPRYTRNGLTTFDVQVFGGFTSNGYNAAGKTSNILEIYGNYDIAELGIGSISNPQSNNYNAILADLYGSGVNASGTGNLSYSGKYTSVEADIYIAQNFCHGLFLDLIIPIRRVQVKDVTYTDISTGPDTQSIEWLTTLANLNNIFAQYNLNAGDYKKSGIGDLLLFLGWAYSNTECEALDFVDTTIKVGISMPSAAKKNEDYAFAIPLGYDGHVAFPIYFDAAIGMFDWLTAGVHLDGVFYTSRSKLMRLNTNPNQTGMFKLLEGEAKRSMGSQVDVSAYLKGDHLFHGLSILAGYNYSYKGHDTLNPVNPVSFSPSIVNVDPTLASWDSQSILIGAEYDFADEGKKFNPHINLFYTRPLAGKRVYKANNVGGTVGLHVAWDF